MTEQTLRTVFQRRPYTNAVADKGIGTQGAALHFVEMDLISKAMPDICDLKFDIGEITLTDYIMCRDFGKPIVGLPVFVTRNFLHGRIWYHTRSAIKTPKDLEGKRVGLKSYTQTAPFWNRGILASEYGVDLGKITWVNLEPAHVAEYRNPGNVEPAPVGATLAEMLESGAIDAADDPGRPWSDRGETWDYDPDVIKPLIPDARHAAIEWYDRTGIYPILHMIVLKQDAIERVPTLASDLFAAFVRARDEWMPTINDPAVYRQRGRDIVGKDFLPYGVEPSRPTLELACRQAYEQGLTSKPIGVEDLFGPDMMVLKA